MNTEHDKDLSALYGQTDREQPPAHLDDAILAAARRATRSRPHPAFTPFSNNWRVPVSLVAVLVLSISLVNLMDDASTPTDGFAPLALEEGELMPTEEQRAAGMPAEKSMSDPEQSPKREKPGESDAGQLNFRSAPLEKSAPVPATTRVAPAATPEPASSGIREEVHARQAQEQKKNEQTARKQKDRALSDSRDRVATLGLVESNAIAPVATVAEITALRESGKPEQARVAADNFIRHYFGDDLDQADADKVTLADTEWTAMVQELRLLGRVQQADRLEKLRQARHSK